MMPGITEYQYIQTTDSLIKSFLNLSTDDPDNKKASDDIMYNLHKPPI